MMNDYVGMLKRMADMTIGHTNNVMRITEGMCNGGVALVTDKEGNQGIFTPASRKGSFKSLEMFKKLAEKNGLTVDVVRPDWADKEESEHNDNAKKPNKDHQTVKNDHESDDSSNQVIDPSVIGDLDIEVDEDNKKAKVTGHGVNREISVEDINAYHSGLLDACAMLGIDLPKLLNGEGETVTKEEVAKFLKTKEGKKVVSEVVAKLTGELAGEAETKETPKKEKKIKKEGVKKVPYQFKEPDEKSRDFLDKHIKLQELDEAMAGEDFDDKRRNYIKNVIISEIEWAYKRGDKFFPKEDDFIKFEVENISKNNVIYLKRPDLRMVIVPFRWERKIYRIFVRSKDEAKNVAEINAWIEGKVREEEVRNQEKAAAAATKEAEKATENETDAK